MRVWGIGAPHESRRCSRCVSPACLPETGGQMHFHSGHERPRSRSEIRYSRSTLMAVWLVAFATRAHAICSTTICTAYVPPIANACEIKQSYTIDDGCQLNFGSKAVTIQGTSTLQSAVGNDYTIVAGSLTVRGKLLARGGSLVLFTTGNISTLGTQGKL